MSDLEFVGRHGPDFARLKRKFTVSSWDRKQRLFAAAERPRLLHVRDGAVVADGRRILDPKFKSDTLYWSQKTEHGFSSAVLHFTRDRLAFAGQIFSGIDETSAVCEDVSGAVDPTVFDTKIATAPLPADGSAGSAPGVKVEFGYVCDHPGRLPSPLLRFDGEEAAKEVSSIGVNPTTGHLQISVFFNASLTAKCAERFPQWPASAAIDIADDGMSFDGWTAYYDAENDDASTVHHRWSGQARPDVTAVKTESLFAMAAPARVEVSGLSIAELITIQPEASELHKSAFVMLIENLKYAMDQDLLAAFFGEIKPDLSRNPNRAKAVMAAADFYNKRFGPAYFGYNFGKLAGPTAPSNQLSADDVAKLNDYLSGGISAEKDYAGQNQGLVVDAYVMNAPRLQDYLNDGGEKWAQRVYDNVTSPAQINVMVNRVIATRSMELAKNTATLLLTLQPGGALSEKYHKLLLSRMMLNMGQSAKFDDRAASDKWIEDFLTQFLLQYLHAPENGTSQQLALHELAEELEEARKKVGGIAELADAFGDALVSLISWDSAKIAGAETKLMARLGKAARALKFVALAGGALFAIMGFTQWDKLSDTGKAEVIISAIAVVGTCIEGVPALIQFGKSFSLDDIVSINNMFDGDAATIPYQALEELEQEEDWVSIGTGSVTGTFDRTGREVIVDGTEWAARFKNAARMLKWLGPAVSAAFAVVSWIDFADGLGDKSTEDKAFQGIIACAQSLETVILVMDLAAEVEVIPFAGPVLALIGVIFVFVEMFKSHPKPQSPVEAYLDSAVRPFIATLPMPLPAPPPPAHAAAVAVPAFA